VRKPQQSKILIMLLVLFGIILLWSAVNPKDYLLWALEVAPAIIGIGLCIYFYRKQPFTLVTYTWCFIAAGIMAIGAHYSYSEVPLFNLIQDAFNSDRNNYDKMGHVVQGLLPVLISQEVLIRNRVILSSQWINFLSVCIALSVAAAYELIEWSALLFGSETTENFLGMQGYAWDAQSDMLYALVGALLALLFTRSLRRAIAKSMRQTIVKTDRS
jgi:putative membrane protein